MVEVVTACGEVSRHFIGTPTATGILNAFLDFDDEGPDGSGPPLDPDYSLLNSSSLACTDEGCQSIGQKRSVGEDNSTSCGSTRFYMCASDSEDESAGEEEEEGPYSFQPQAQRNAEDGDDHYEDDFEAESEDEAEIQEPLDETS